MPPVTQSIRANNGVNYAVMADTPVANNTEYHSYQPLATIAPVPQAAPFIVMPAAPAYTTQLSSGQAAPESSSAAATFSAPVQTVSVPSPAAALSPANQASQTEQLTTTSPSTDSLIANILANLSAGTNASPSGTGAGVGNSSTSLPPPSAANVASLQPQAATTTSSGPNLVLILGIIALGGVGIYLYYRHHMKV